MLVNFWSTGRGKQAVAKDAAPELSRTTKNGKRQQGTSPKSAPVARALRAGGGLCPAHSAAALRPAATTRDSSPSASSPSVTDECSTNQEARARGFESGLLHRSLSKRQRSSCIPRPPRRSPISPLRNGAGIPSPRTSGCDVRFDPVAGERERVAAANARRVTRGIRAIPVVRHDVRDRIGKRVEVIR